MDVAQSTLTALPQLIKSCLCILLVSLVPSQIPPKLNLFGNRIIRFPHIYIEVEKQETYVTKCQHR